jgi:hypothetical protein
MRNIAFVLILPASLIFSLVYSPRIVINNQVDFHSLETIAKSIVKPGMTDREKAEAVWRFVIKHVFHYKAPTEGHLDNRSNLRFEMNNVYDPLKTLNVYGYTYCYANISIMKKLWEKAGLDSTRLWGIGGHLITEVYYDNAWHHFDGDQSVSAYFLKDDGKTVASLKEIESDPDKYILHPKYKSKPSMPYDKNPIYLHESRAELAGFYRSKDNNYIRDRAEKECHQMDYYLRRNESLTLFFEKKGRWRHNGMDWAYINPANGPYDAHTSRTYSNGLFEYTPDLSDRNLIKEGFYSSKNIKMDGTITLVQADKPGEFVIKVASPYIIAGIPVHPSRKELFPCQFYDAARISGYVDAKKHRPVYLEIQVSADHMFGQYKSIFTQPACGYFSVDLSEVMSVPTYYYFVKVILKKGKAVKKDNGKKGGIPYIEKLNLKTWVQVNPLSIPFLRSGINRIRYSVDGPPVDKVDIKRIFGQGNELDYPLTMDNINQAKDRTSSRIYSPKDKTKKGVLVFKVDSPEGEIYDHWFATLFSMRHDMKSAVYYSENDTISWKKVPQKDKLYSDHWADWLSAVIPAGEKVKRVYYKVVLMNGASLALMHYGYRYKYLNPAGRITVTHGVTVNGRYREFSKVLDRKKGTYKIRVLGKKVKNRFLRYKCR